jgi:type II secretory pathway component PulF
MALSYPLLLLVAAVAVVLFIGNQTLPQLIRILRESHVAVPALTQAVQLTGQIALTWCWLIVPAVIGAVIAVRSAVARLDPQRGLRLRLSRLPWNRARQRLRVAAIAGVLSQLLRSGVGLAEALDVAGRTASEKPMRDLLAACAAGVRRGEPLSATVSASPLLDPEFAQLLRVGEQTGELAAMCARITERYERAAQRSIDRLAAFLEPVAILIMAAIIGTVVMAAILPLLALGDIL